MRITTSPIRPTRYVVAGLLGCALAFGGAPAIAEAATSSDIQAELDAAQAQLAEYNRAAAQAGAELDKASYDLDQTRQQIEEVQGKIEEQRVELAGAQVSLSNSLAGQYKAGSVSLLDMVLGATSFEDLVSRVTYANKVSESFEASISEVRELQAELEASEAELTAKEDEQEKQVSDLEVKMVSSQQAEQEAEQYVNSLSSDLREALAAEEAARQEASRLEAERLAAEEAAKQEAANQGSTSTSEPSQDTSQPSGQPSTPEPPSTDSGTSSSRPSQDSGNQAPSTPNNGGSTLGETAVYWAKTQLGKPYGHDNDGTNWDCNGLTHWAWAQAGYSIPVASGHYGYGQFQYMKNSGRWVTSVSQLKPGDLVFYSYDGGVTTYHVAMYIGNYQVIHSNGWGSGVVITGIYYDTGFCGGGTP